MKSISVLRWTHNFPKEKSYFHFNEILSKAANYNCKYVFSTKKVSLNCSLLNFYQDISLSVTSDIQYYPKYINAHYLSFLCPNNIILQLKCFKQLSAGFSLDVVLHKSIWLIHYLKKRFLLGWQYIIKLFFSIRFASKHYR